MDAKLKHVVAVGQFGSFTRAAEAVGVGQSTITKSVAEIERQLGHPLFHRTARGASPTELGEEFLTDASRLLADAEELFRGNRAGSDKFAAPLRIGVAPASLEWLAVEPAVHLLKRHPRARLELSGGAVERTVELLRRGSIDVAVCPSFAFFGGEEFTIVEAGQIETKLFVARSAPLARKQLVSRSDLAKHALIVPMQLEPLLTSIREIYEEAGGDWRTNVHAIDNFPAVQRFVEELGLIGLVSAQYASTHRFQKRFQTLRCEPLFDDIPVSCAYRRRWTPKPAALAFCRTLQAQLSGIPVDPKKAGGSE